MHISCTICTELYQSNEETGLTKCGHLFHIECVKPWLQKHKTCPHCRADSSVQDLTRVFFTEISSEDVHINRNCKTNSLKAIIASEKEHVKNLEIDLRQAQNDLIDMNKHIETYENELRNLKILNESLLDNNEKVERENKKLTEKINLKTNTRNCVQCELKNDVTEVRSHEKETDIIELKTIIASYEEANQQYIAEVEFLQKQLNEVIIENEELQMEIFKEANSKNIMTVPRKKMEHLIVNQRKKVSYQIKNFKLKKRNELSKSNLCKNNEQNLLYPETKQVKNKLTNHPPAKILNTPTITTTERDSSKSIEATSESSRKARKQLTRFKSCPLSSTDTIHENDSTTIRENITRSESFRKAREQIAKLKLCSNPQTHMTTVTKQSAPAILNSVTDKGCNEAFNQELLASLLTRNNKEVFEFTSKLPSTESFRISKKHVRAPMPPPRVYKTFTSLPPCPPPRCRIDKPDIILFTSNKNDSNSNQRNITSSTPVVEHPLMGNKINRNSPVGSIPLLGLCKSQFRKTEIPAGSKETTIVVEDISADQDKIQDIEVINKDEEKTLTKTDSNA